MNIDISEATNNLLEKAKELSGLDTDKQIERALKIWLELFDLEKQYDCVFTPKNSSMVVRSWELICDKDHSCTNCKAGQ